MAGDFEAVYPLFAELLEYPTSGLSQAVRQCIRLVEQLNPDAASYLLEFADFANGVPLGCLEETYTGAFDLKAAYSPYVGYHLFGDTYNRSLFLVGLSERYHQHGFTPGRELPDHLAVMLRFLAICPDPTMKAELIQDALLPAVEHLTRSKAGKGDDEAVEAQPAEENKYRLVLDALHETLHLAAACHAEEAADLVQAVLEGGADV